MVAMGGSGVCGMGGSEEACGFFVPHPTRDKLRKRPRRKALY